MCKHCIYLWIFLVTLLIIYFLYLVWWWEYEWKLQLDLFLFFFSPFFSVNISTLPYRWKCLSGVIYMFVFVCAQINVIHSWSNWIRRKEGRKHSFQFYIDIPHLKIDWLNVIGSQFDRFAIKQILRIVTSIHSNRKIIARQPTFRLDYCGTNII